MPGVNGPTTETTASAASSSDRDIKRAANSDELIRNVYKILLTRGLRGCIIYSVDQETRQMLAGLGIPSLPAAASG
jgi:DUF2075 family protein